MKCRLVMEDWRRTGEPGSIYSTPLGVQLSLGDLHSGTTLDAVIELPADITAQMKAAWREHGAYAVFRVMPNDMNSPGAT